MRLRKDKLEEIEEQEKYFEDRKIKVQEGRGQSDGER